MDARKDLACRRARTIAATENPNTKPTSVAKSCGGFCGCCSAAAERST